MKFGRISFFVFCTFIFFSCSNGKINDVSQDEPLTIKQIVVQKDAAENWTKEIEQNLLSEPLENQIINGTVVQSSETFKAVYFAKNPVFPDVKDFGSLDVSSLNAATLSCIKTFCNNVKNNKLEENGSLFDEKYIFNAVFFNNSIKTLWIDSFEEEFPLNTEEKTYNLFTAYIPGKPEYSTNSSFAEVPVLFSSKNKKVYVKILVKPEDEPKIYQAYVYKWEKIDD